MKQNRAQKDILYISISIFVLVVLWIGFNLYHAYVTSTIAPDLQLQIAPIDPKFDTEIINKLKTREKIAPLYENIASSSPTISQPPSVQEAQQASSGSALTTPAGFLERLGR